MDGARLIACAFSAGPLMGTIAGFWPSGTTSPGPHFYRHGSPTSARALLSGDLARARS
jgi:hypothetical protein